MNPNWSATFTIFFYQTSHIPRSLSKTSLCGIDADIDIPGKYREYYGCPKIVGDLCLINLSTINPLEFPRDPSTGVANDTPKLSIINASGIFLCPPPLIYLRIINIGSSLNTDTVSVSHLYVVLGVYI